MTSVLAIDPGSERSAWVAFNVASGRPWDFDIMENALLVEWLTGKIKEGTLAIEYMRARGMPISNDELDTQFWAGRFVQAWSGDHALIYRRDVKMHLCQSVRANDKNIYHALLNRFGNGTRQSCVGTKKKPGPLYGFKADLWSALAIAVTWADLYAGGEQRPGAEVIIYER